MTQPLLINGQLQHYIWGGTRLLPQLLNIDNSENRPYAELWFGTHASAPATLVKTEVSPTLDTYLKAQGCATLPYLLKVLDVANPLSIQVHPNLQQAKVGFARENAAGIPLTAGNRNYKDDNHKPEIMVALNDCYLLYGFSDPLQIAQRLQKHPCLQPLLKWLEEKTFKDFYQALMRIDDAQKVQLIEPLLDQLIQQFKQGELNKSDHDYWVAKAALAQPALTESPQGKPSLDPGLLTVYTMNLVFVPQGKGIFQPAQLPHAYLEGGNIELMANSDNVLRGGLTPKHVDIDELLSVMIFEVAQPKLIDPVTLDNGWLYYPSPSDEVTLHRCQPKPNLAYTLPDGVQRGQILLNIGDSCELLSDKTSITIAPGQAAFIPADCTCQIHSHTAGSILFLAS